MLIQVKAVKNVLVIAVSSMIVICAIIFYLDYTRLFIFLPKTKQQINFEVKTLFNSIPLNVEKTEIISRIRPEINGKRFHINDNDSVVQIIPPYDYTFTWSWTIFILFDNRGKSIGVAIRPIDDVRYWFCDAPKDKGIIPKGYQHQKNCIQ